MMKFRLSYVKWERKLLTFLVLCQILPTQKCRRGATLARENGVDYILAVGGGSVVDCCKIVAAQAKTEKDLWEMEFVERQFPTDAIPIGAIVTASGTGARNEWRARSLQTKKKKLKTGMLALAPRFAVLDPAYTLSVPRMQVISGAFDTLSHAMETYFGKFGSGQRVRRFGVGRYA